MVLAPFLLENVFVMKRRRVKNSTPVTTVPKYYVRWDVDTERVYRVCVSVTMVGLEALVRPRCVRQTVTIEDFAPMVSVYVLSDSRETRVRRSFPSHRVQRHVLYRARRNVLRVSSLRSSVSTMSVTESALRVVLK